MNFQELKKIETPQTYLDIAFNKASKRGESARDKEAKDRITKSKFIESARIAAVEGSLAERLKEITKNFPSLDDLPIFYLELIKITIDYNLLKKSLGGIGWAEKQIRKLTSNYTSKINKCKELTNINVYRREYYGRVSSIMKQIKKELLFLEEARKEMKKFPAIKTSLFTIAICGFPNIGKTTLLSKLSGSKPEINEYAFTTKSLNMGYIKENDTKIQLIDTPGTLNRINKMNAIEKQAYLAIQYCADVMIYIFDLTEPFPLESQEKLLKNLKKQHPKKEIIIFLSKIDIIEKEVIDSFIKDKKEIITNINVLKEKIIEIQKKYTESHL
jgi:nucleolar GTP-binding protein